MKVYTQKVLELAVESGIENVKHDLEQKLSEEDCLKLYNAIMDEIKEWFTLDKN